MAIKYKHSDCFALYFCTFTCFKWLPLFEITNTYDTVYKWFNIMKDNNWQTISYVIMPNHLHTIHYFPDAGFNLNSIISNAKRFMGYEIIQRLEASKNENLLQYLSQSLNKTEQKKGMKHRIFEHSFDAKAIYTPQMLRQKINYIHLNPVRGKWQLAQQYTDYEHSSASFYEQGEIKHFAPFDYRQL